MKPRVFLHCPKNYQFKQNAAAYWQLTNKIFRFRVYNGKTLWVNMLLNVKSIVNFKVKFQFFKEEKE